MEFFNYFRALQYAPKAKTYPIALCVIGYLIIMFNFYMGSINIWVSCLVSFAFFSGLAVSYWTQSSPNLENVFPINHKKKLLYRFLSSLFMFLICVLSLILIGLIVCLFVLLVIALVGGNAGWTTEDSEVINEIFVGSLGTYGGLFSAAYFIIMYSAGMITSFIKRRKNRNIFLVCLCVCIPLSSFFMGLPYYIKNHTFGYASPIFQIFYDAMKFPWISTIFWFLVAGAMLGTSIYMGIKHYNPKKF